MGCGGSTEEKKETKKEVKKGQLFSPHLSSIESANQSTVDEMVEWLRDLKKEYDAGTPNDKLFTNLEDKPTSYEQKMVKWQDCPRDVFQCAIEKHLHEHGLADEAHKAAKEAAAKSEEVEKFPLHFNNRTLITPRMQDRQFTIEKPANLAELKKVMTDAAAAGKLLRPYGTQYAFDNVTMADDVVMVDMIANLDHPKLNDTVDTQAAFKALLNQDGRTLLEGDYLWKSEAGTTQQQITEKAWPMDAEGAAMKPPQRTTVWENKAENKKWKMLQVLAGYHQLSMGGTIAVAAQGQGSGKKGALQNQVRSFHLVTFDENKKLVEYQMEPTTGGIYDKDAWDAHQATLPEDQRVTLIQNDEAFNAALVSVGSFGIVYSFDFELTDATMLKEEHYSTNWNSFKPQYEELFARTQLPDDDPNFIYRMEIGLSPYYKWFTKDDLNMVVMLQYKGDDDAKVDPLKNFGSLHSQTFVEGYWVGMAPVLVSHCPWLAHTLPLILKLAIDSTTHKEALTADAISLLSLGAPSSVPTQVAAMVVSHTDILKAVDAWAAVMNVSISDTPVTSPCGITWCGEAYGYIGMNSGWSSAWIEMPYPDYTSKTKTEVWDGSTFPKASWVGATTNWESTVAKTNSLLTDPKYNFNGRMHLGLSRTSVFFDKELWNNKKVYPNFDTYLAQYKKFNASRVFCSDFTSSTGLDELAGFTGQKEPVAPFTFPATFNLKTDHGTFIRAKPDKTVDTAEAAKEWEAYTAEDKGDGKYTIKSHHGTYLRSDPEGTVNLADEAKEWEVWTVEHLGSGKINLKSFHGKYLRAEPGADATVNQTDVPNEWEQFTAPEAQAVAAEAPAAEEKKEEEAAPAKEEEAPAAPGEEEKKDE